MFESVDSYQNRGIAIWLYPKIAVPLIVANKKPQQGCCDNAHYHNIYSIK